MEQQWLARWTSFDGRERLEVGVRSALGTIVAMAIGFAMVGGVLLAEETVILWTTGTRIVALLAMYVLPQFVAGYWLGTRGQRGITGPIAAGFAPVVMLTIALGGFGGPVSSVFQTPLLTASAILVWSVTFACGQHLGATRLEGRRDERGRQSPSGVDH